MRPPIVLTSVLFLSAALQACASTQWVAATLPYPTVRPSVTEGQTIESTGITQTRDGISITVLPITPENVQRFPQVYPTFTWQEVEGASTAQMFLFGASRQIVQRSGNGNILPYPSFQVRIANRTGHVIRFTSAVLRLQDNTGQTYPTFTTIQELIAWNIADFGARGSSPEIQRQVQTSVGTLQLLTRATELLNGDEWTGYLAFNTGTTAEYDTLMARAQRFTLRMAEVPVDTNEAGQTSRTTEFSFRFDRSTFNRSARCPEGTPPSPQSCRYTN